MLLSRTTYILAILLISLLIFQGCKTLSKKGAGQTVELNEKEKIALDSYFINANREKILGNFDEALDMFSKCLKIVPNHSASMYEMAAIYELKNNDQEAITLLKKAVKLQPKNEWYHGLLGEIYLKLRKYGDAANVYESLSEMLPSKIEYKYELASALIYTGKLKEAVEIYNDIEFQMGVSEDISMQKFRIFAQLKDEGRAVREITKLIDQNPQDPRFLGVLSEYYQKEGNMDKAMEYLEKIREIDPENPQVNLSLANHYRSEGKMEESFLELKKAFSNESLDIDTKIQIMLSYYALIETHPELQDQAMELGEILTATHKDDAKSFSMMGDFYYRDGNLEKAEEAYKSALKIDQSKFVIWSQVCIINSELLDFKDMGEISETAIELFPSQPSFYMFKAVAEIQLKNYKAAIENLNTGKSLVFDNRLLLSQFYSYLGESYHYVKDYPNSDSSFVKSIELNKKNVSTLNNYSYYLSERGENLERAEEYSKLSNDLEPGNSSYLDTYGWVLFKMGKYEEALKWLEKAYNSGGGGSGVIMEHVGDAYFKLNNIQKALEFWNKAVLKKDFSDLLEKKISDKTYYE